MKATLVIEGRLASLNEYTESCRTVKGKYFAGNKVKRMEQARVVKAIMEQLDGVHFLGTVHMDFRWYEPNKRRDIDNIAFAKKFILDAMVETKLIVNDDQRYFIGYKDYFLVEKENPRVEVTIYRV